MKYIKVISEGDSYSLDPQLCDDPSLSDNDVLIKVAYAGVNRADIYQAQGNYRPPKGASDILGLEVSGEIVEIGKEVKSYKVGDKVCALTPGAGYAEYVSVPEWRVLSVPEGLSLEQSAALPETFFTVYLNLFEIAGLKPGETILIHGGASGIGTTAIQLAREFGAKIFTTVGSREKCDFCEELGADKAINYKTEEFDVIIDEITKGQGVDVVLDMVGGDYFQKNFKLLKKRGRYVSIAFICGAKSEMNFAPLLLKNLTMVGSTLRSRNEEEIYNLAQSLRTMVWPMFESGKIKPIIDSVYSFDKANEAHERMLNFKHIGKILLNFSSQS